MENSCQSSGNVFRLNADDQRSLLEPIRLHAGGLDRAQHQQRVEHNRHDRHGDQRSAIAHDIEQIFEIELPDATVVEHFASGDRDSRSFVPLCLSGKNTVSNTGQLTQLIPLLSAVWAELR